MGTVKKPTQFSESPKGWDSFDDLKKGWTCKFKIINLYPVHNFV